MTIGKLRGALLVSVATLTLNQAMAQETAAPAGQQTAPAAEGAAPAATAPQNQLPQVDVIQKKVEPKPEPVQQAEPKPKPKPVQKAEPKYQPKPVAKKAAPKPQPAPETEPDATPEVVEAATAAPAGVASGTVQMSPLAGSELPINKVAGAVGRSSASDIARTGETSAPDALQRTVPGVVLTDAQGNVFQRTMQYRGYDSSPVNGAAQGLAVYQNGVRINESFGDIVNWDFLPSNAIDNMTIIGANPVFGLNAIGGAAVVNMRDGFNFHGTEIDVRAGSFGRIQGSMATGLQSGIWSAFLAVEGIQDDGFRDFSPAEIKRGYADIGVKTSDVELHLNITGAQNHVGVTAAAPMQLLDLDWERTFTSPQTTDNEVGMVSLNGTVKATPTLTLGGVAYYRSFQQRHDDGNILEAEVCTVDDPATPDNEIGKVCLEEDGAVEAARNDDGETMDFDPNLHYGSIDRTGQDANGYGIALQAVEKSPVFGLPNQFLIGVSYDHGKVDYFANSELGFFKRRFVVSGFDDPFMLDDPADFAERSLTTENDDVGLYFSDTIDLTQQLALTVGGRYNWARLDLQNNAFEPENPGDEDPLTGTHHFQRFNPNVGLTYTFNPALTVYGSYAEANRAPTAAELACADPENPCLIESFLTADPPLEQVVSKTYELGLRGELASWGGGQRLQWSLGYFHATNENDIIAVAAPVSGRGFFQNAGDTQRQGIEAAIQYRDSKWAAYANYSYVDAEFRNHLELASPDNPEAIDCPSAPGENCVLVAPGDRLPGVPRHKFKAGIDYWMTSKWLVGADLTAVSNQIYFGDEGNDARPLPGYTTVDLHTSYDITENVQIYGLINNVFDERYGVFGNFFNLDLGNEGADADGLGDDFFTDPRTITPAPPVAAYGGLKMKF